MQLRVLKGGQDPNNKTNESDAQQPELNVRLRALDEENRIYKYENATCRREPVKVRGALIVLWVVVL